MINKRSYKKSFEWIKDHLESCATKSKKSILGKYYKEEECPGYHDSLTFNDFEKSLSMSDKNYLTGLIMEESPEEERGEFLLSNAEAIQLQLIHSLKVGSLDESIALVATLKASAVFYSKSIREKLYDEVIEELISEDDEGEMENE